MQVVNHKFQVRTIRFMQFLEEVSAMTSIAEDLVEIPNRITQLNNFLFLIITLDYFSSHNHIPRF